MGPNAVRVEIAAEEEEEILRSREKKRTNSNDRWRARTKMRIV